MGFWVDPDKEKLAKPGENSKNYKLVLFLDVFGLFRELNRAARIARLPCSLLDPELFPHTAYVKILATLARKTVN